MINQAAQLIAVEKLLSLPAAVPFSQGFQRLKELAEIADAPLP
jgi:hypothetical protein